MTTYAYFHNLRWSEPIEYDTNDETKELIGTLARRYVKMTNDKAMFRAMT